MTDKAWNEFEEGLKRAVAGFSSCEGMNLVLGEGNRSASVTLIGEAPGAQEDKAGRPFVGPAGRQLDEILNTVGLEREAVWITNVVKCRPTELKNGRVRNRPPSQEEFDQFLPWLERELKLVEPELLVCLGATAARAILGRKSVKMAETRGNVLNGVLGIDTIVTYHPSFLLRRTSTRDARLEESIADFRLVRERIDHNA